MKNIFNKITTNAVVFCLTLSFLFLTTACSKKEAFVPKGDKEQCELNSEKGPWTWIGVLVGIVTIVIEVTEGQYHEETTVNPDGTYTIIKECKGWGHCHMAANLIGPGNTIGAAVSSKQENDGYDFTGKAQLIKTSTGHVLLKMENNRDNDDACKRFFYDSALSFSQPFVVDNEKVLEQLGTGKTPIVIEGEYEVYDAQDGKFIIIK